MRSAAVVFVFALTACTTAHAPATSQSVMAPVEEFVRALSHADADALAEAFAPDATLFMPFDELPRRIEGAKAIRDAFAPYFDDLRASDRTPPYFKLEPRDLAIQSLGDDVAVVTFHLGELPPGETEDPVRFSRRSVVVRRYANGWRIAHLHASNMLIAPGQ